MPKKSQTNAHKELIKEVKSLSKEVRKLKGLEFVKVLKHPWKLMGLSLLKGMMVGLGSVLGASVLVALFIYIIAQISFVPILGDLVEEVMGQISLAQPETTEEIEGEPNFIDQYESTKKNIEEADPQQSEGS